tara:strand:+ start:30979 stop:33570 length:2592 start_codon:yes stop_codon:yes gene_type:complete
MKLSSQKIRQDFIDFFLDKKHKIVRSSPVFPLEDPTLLFINAGMNQFKNIFLGTEDAQFKRVVNSQKCIRVSGKHNDLEEVGLDQYHHTFFEMLGNWSFGDFSKKEIIIWSWELLTEKWKLDKNRLWVTVYKDDDEAYELWINNTDVKPDRVLRFGDKDNFWEMGDTGPCGPCSEIHYYTGDLDKQVADGVNKLSEYRELWNLVFIEFNRSQDGSLSDLPDKHVDTGMGLERIVATLNNLDDHYKTDLFLPIIDKIEKISGVGYSTVDSGMAHRVIADHLRMIAFSIADGIMPSNEGRGYVVRRVLRRAARFGRVLNIKSAFLYKLVDVLIDIIGDVYPELLDKQKHIKKVIENEEVSFGKTLDRGLLLMNEIISSLDDKMISGEQVFKLYDTYGFPVDLTQLIAKENGCDIDINSFNKYMDKQKDKARSSSKFKNSHDKNSWNEISDIKGSFIGYSTTSNNSEIIKYRYIDTGIEIVMKETPFYAESGGQIGDIGIIKSDDIHLDVVDTYKLGDDICHLCKLISGDLNKKFKNSFELLVDDERRNKIRANHSATHLLHKSLKIVLGNHIQQAGSLVSDDKLRFDLTHYEKLSVVELSDIENKVNSFIMKNFKVGVSNESYDDAKKMGAEALFGEKYGDIVRVINIGNSSIELCGGTHVNRTGDIGLFKIISESALASGIRRIEALTGINALSYVNNKINLVNDISNKLQCNNKDVSLKIDNLIDMSKKSVSIEKEIEKIKINNLFNSSNIIYNLNNGVKVFKSEIDYNIDAKNFVDSFLSNYSDKSIFLLGVKTKKPLIVLSVSKDLSKEKINAGLLVKEIAKSIGSGGGGPKHFGTAGFVDIKLYNKAYDSILKFLEKIEV